MPISKTENEVSSSKVKIPLISAVSGELKSWVDKLKKPFYPSTADHDKDHDYTEVYSREKDYLFDHSKTFTPSLRFRILEFLLQRSRFTEDPDDLFGFGIARLISDGVFIAAYPLHDGDIYSEGSQRKLLFDEWASWKNIWKFQPLDSIKEYFGVKIGFYYVWLGYYNVMLIIPSIVGVLCFFYGVYCYNTDIAAKEICEGSMTNVTMCPICDTFCDYWKLRDACQEEQLKNLFDNEATVFFALFMSIWGVIFTEFWKRYSAEFIHKWDVFGSDPAEVHPRPEYLAELRDVEEETINLISHTLEPKPRFWKMKFPAVLLSFASVAMLLVLTLITVIAIIVYRMSMTFVLADTDSEIILSQWTLIISVSSAILNAAIIFVLDYLYVYIAVWLTEKELLRTQTDFDDSLTVKIYLFHFVNSYASIFYIAFFKGRFIGTPNNYLRFFEVRQEECPPGGCFMELCIQLAIIFIVQQFLQSFFEILMPIISKFVIRSSSGLRGEGSNPEEVSPQYIKDFKLLEWGQYGLVYEYLEMVIQFGFLTIFVSAFPLAPFFAFLNNVLELRIDARKLLVQHRRPTAKRVQSIGVWFVIMETLAKISVVSNGLIIALTSEFIPRTLYKMMVSQDGSLIGYIDFTLSKLDPSDLDLGPHPHPHEMSEAPVFCRYEDYRNSYDSTDKYNHSQFFYHVWFARIVFFVIYQNFITLVMMLLKIGIPDIPTKLKTRMNREKYITKEVIIEKERRRELQIRIKQE